MQSANPLSILPDFRSEGLGISSVAASKDEIYIFAGLYYLETNEIVQMNATTQDYRRVPIENLDFQEGVRWDMAPTSVWVEKLNRIYFFGGSRGYLWGTWNVDEIWYIDLD